MGVLDMFYHLINFALPALVLGLVLPLAMRLGPMGRRQMQPTLAVQCMVTSGVGLLVLISGLLLWGRDGKMLTYFGLAVACATSQWVMLRAWRV